MKRILSLILVISLALAVGSPKAPASGASSSVYQRMIAKLHSLKTYQATISATLTLQPTNGQGQGNTINSTETILYKNPNKLALKMQGMMGGILIVSNGKTIYQYSGLTNQYTAKPAPTNLLSSIVANAGFNDKLRTVGSTAINGVPVTELKGSTTTAQGPVQTTLYIGTRDALPYRIVATMAHLPGQQGAAFRMISEQSFTNQKVNVPVPESAFHFVPPANATKVTSLGGFGGPGASGAIP